MATINPLVSILIPTYNGSQYIKETLDSIFNQNYPHLEVIINDDCSTDNTIKIARSYSHIKIFRNKKNQGYSLNLQLGFAHVTGDILLLMGQDDILAPATIKKYVSLFNSNPKVGAITRPYYWFDTDLYTPVRYKKALNQNKDEIVSLRSDPKKIIKVIDTLDQLSGLAFRTKWIDTPFHPDIFPCHIYPFLSILKKHPIIYVKDYNLAVRIASSQTRKVSSIYQKSPIKSWKEMIDSIFPSKNYPLLNQSIIKDFVARNYIGLVQIKNYGKFSWLWREIGYLIYYRWQNIFNPFFWIFSLSTIIIPAKILIKLVDNYKKLIYSQLIKDEVKSSF